MKKKLEIKKKNKLKGRMMTPPGDENEERLEWKKGYEVRQNDCNNVITEWVCFGTVFLGSGIGE